MASPTSTPDFGPSRASPACRGRMHIQRCGQKRPPHRLDTRALDRGLPPLARSVQHRCATIPNHKRLDGGLSRERPSRPHAAELQRCLHPRLRPWGSRRGGPNRGGSSVHSTRDAFGLLGRRDLHVRVATMPIGWPRITIRHSHLGGHYHRTGPRYVLRGGRTAFRRVELVPFQGPGGRGGA